MEHFHCYHGSLDKKFTLWRMGDGNLAIVNLANFKVSKLLPSFWTFDDRNCMPVASCGSPGMNKIVASSMASANEHIIHYWQRNMNEPQSSECKEKIPGFMRISCIDCDSRGDILVLGGLSSPRYNHKTRRSQSSTMFVTVNFGKNFEKYGENIYPLNRYGKPRRIKRIPESNIFLIGALFNVVIMELNQDKKLHQIALLENIHKSEITDFYVFEDKIISKGYREKFVTVSYLGRKGETGNDTDRYYLKELTDGEKRKRSIHYGIEENKEQIFDKKPKNNFGQKKLMKYEPVEIEEIRTQNSNTSFEKISLSKRGDYIYAGGEENIQIFHKIQKGKYKFKSTKSKLEINFF